MKKRLILLFTAFQLLAFQVVFADEGMWLPTQIKGQIEKMRALGLKLSAEDIYSINNASLKDAVVSLGGFCTAEFVSPNGLVLTNHHCAYSAIADRSTPENNFLDKGFWAASYKEELQNPGLKVSRLVRMERVTDNIAPELEGLENGMIRQMQYNHLKDSITNAAIEGTHYKAEIKDLFNDNEYYLFVYEVFTDVRLVGAPPSSIGKFGGDTDNWMWPRHTGDFAFLRVYSGPDGKPADYHEDNIPYKPKHFFPVSLKGVREGDFAMVFGYPGSTQRFLTAQDVQVKKDVSLPAYVNVFGSTLNIMKQDMDADSVVKLKYASRYASLSNAHKYYQGQYKGLGDFDLVADKEAKEADFRKWVNADPERKEKYGSIFDKINENYRAYNSVQPDMTYYLASLNTNQSIGQGFYFYRQLQQLQAIEEGDAPEEMKEQMRERAMSYFDATNRETERKLIGNMLMSMYTNVADSLHPDVSPYITAATAENRQGAINLYVDSLFKNSIFLDKEKTENFINNLDTASAEKLSNDRLVKLTEELLNNYRNKMAPVAGAATAANSAEQSLYVRALREYRQSEEIYPDANSTMRLSYGTIQSYYPRDGVKYLHYTTHQGLLAKEDPNDPEFEVPSKLSTLLKNGDFGRYGEDGSLRINFLSNNDITGGNSGSPVIDAEGNLIGVAFDGNWESMIGDLYFQPELKRTISCDIRYVLFVVDKYANAQRLLDEMDIVEARQTGKSKKKKK